MWWRERASTESRSPYKRKSKRRRHPRLLRPQREQAGVCPSRNALVSCTEAKASRSKGSGPSLPGHYLAPFLSRAGMAPRHRWVGDGQHDHAHTLLPLHHQRTEGEARPGRPGQVSRGRTQPLGHQCAAALPSWDRELGKVSPLGSSGAPVFAFFFFLTGSVAETWSIWRRPAFNCPLSTHWDGTCCSSHTIRQMSD